MSSHVTGFGAYHEKKGFDTFVHKKSVLFKSFFFADEMTQAIRYPPSSDFNIALTRKLFK